MNKVFIFILIFIFLNDCTLNSKSKFWTKEKNIKKEEQKSNKKNLFVLEDALQKELNPSLKIKLRKTKLNYGTTNHNNNSFSDFYGKLEKISKFNFSKIEYFDQYEPEIIFDEENIIFFVNKGTLIKFDKNSDLIWEKNYYTKQEKKKKPIFIFR